MIKATLISLLAGSVALAQSPPFRQVGWGTGLSLGAVRYEGMSQLIQRGKAFPLQFYVLSQGNRNRHFLQLQAATYSNGLTSSNAESTTELATGHLQYAYHRRVGQAKHWTLWAGTLVNLQASIPSFTARVGGMRYQNTTSPALFNSLNVSALLTRPVGRGRLEGQAWLNAVGYNIRPNYAYSYADVDNFKEWIRQGAIETWPLFGQLNARIAYDGYLSPHLRIRLDYKWQYWRTQSPRYTGMLTHQLVSSIAYQF